MTDDEITFIAEEVRKRLAHLDNSTAQTAGMPKGAHDMPKDIALKDFAQNWLTSFKQDSVKESSYDALTRQYQVMCHYPIADMSIQDITAMDIQQYVSQLTQAGYALTTIKKLARIATAPLKKAAALRIIPSDPGVDIRFPSPQKVKKPPRQSDAYTEPEQAALNRRLDVGKRVGYSAIILMIEEGLRVGEVLALDWGDVDIERRKLHVHKTVIRLADRRQAKVMEGAKTFSSNRTIPLTARAILTLNRCKHGRMVECDEPVFLGNDGERLTYEALRYQTQKVCQEAGVAYRGEHAFRHTFATNCYRKGINIKVLSKLLGHASVQITYDTYVHLYGDGFEEMLEALDKTFDSQS